MISRIEKQLKRRFAIGSQVSEHSIVQDFTKQVGVRSTAFFFILMWMILFCKYLVFTMCDVGITFLLLYESHMYLNH